MNVNLTAPAFPCTPMKDQFNQWIVPNAGINKLEYFTLENKPTDNEKTSKLVSL